MLFNKIQTNLINSQILTTQIYFKKLLKLINCKNFIKDFKTKIYKFVNLIYK